MRLFSIFISLLSVLVFIGGEAYAGTDRELTFKEDQIWKSAIRFLRVEQKFKIQEKDKSAGYILFEYRDTGRTYQASMEIIPRVQENRKIILVKVNIQSMPRYVSAVLLDQFERKLKNEYGAAPVAELLVPQTESNGADDNDNDTNPVEDDLENEEQE